ncbi:unnamed protein product [Amaranthus hypochondriacus]
MQSYYPCPPNQAYNNCNPIPQPQPVIIPGSSFNSGGNWNGSGIQKNGDVKVGNKKEKSGGVDIGSIGGNHENQGGQQIAGDIHLGNIGC